MKILFTMIILSFPFCYFGFGYQTMESNPNLPTKKTTQLQSDNNIDYVYSSDMKISSTSNSKCPTCPKCITCAKKCKCKICKKCPKKCPTCKICSNTEQCPKCPKCPPPCKKCPKKCKKCKKKQKCPKIKCKKCPSCPISNESSGLPGLPRKYCQPGETSCWPNKTDIENFSTLINGNQTSCLNLKKFIHVGDPDAHKIKCRYYNGLIPAQTCNKTTGNNAPPNTKCDSNPFVTNAYYNTTDMHNNKMACMTPYQFVNNRNYKNEWMAAFIVTANTTDDVVKAIQFANKHSLGVSVMSTGHEIADRNAGPGPNSLLIRTTCFREWDAHPNEPIKDYNGTEWKDGYVKLGAGHTFGRNFWYKIKHSEGIYALAAKDKREMVGGTCHSVGIVGWTMGGGRGWTAPMHGVGVYQVLHVDMVTADGKEVSANYTHNEDLFWAIRGGGPGFGVITSMKLKMHKPRCRGPTGDVTMENCYTIWNVIYEGSYKGNSTVAYVKYILNKFASWSIQYRPTWTSLVNFWYYDQNNTYKIEIEGRYFALEGEYPDTYNSFNDTFNDTIDLVGTIKKTTTDKYWCEEYFSGQSNATTCTNKPYYMERWPQMIMFLVNSSVLHTDFISALLDTWQPLCEKHPYSPCARGYQFRGDMAAINASTGVGVHANPSAVSHGFNTASFAILDVGLNSMKVKLSFDQQLSFIHFNLAPKLYKYSQYSYFSEAEYTLSPGQWERRFWGIEKHSKLLRLKKMYDPNLIFACHHCVGTEVGTEPLQCGKRVCTSNGIEGKCVANASPSPLNHVKTDGNCEGISCACWIPQPKKFCQPGEECWPKRVAIDHFSSQINGSKHSCLGIKKFVYFGDDYAHQQVCLPYTGLVQGNPCNKSITYSRSFFEPDCSCPNPFIKGAYYKSEGLACMTPYQFLNMRNYKEEWMAAFIVTAESKEDIRFALKFAEIYNLGISVINTGHDWQDRTAGPGRNTLQIRTTCFRRWEPEPKKTIKDIHGHWYDGYVRIGAGLTFGTNFWTNVTNAKGIYKLAAEENKEMVGGNAHSVGVVGCTIGGCRGWTSPMYGLGADQLLNAEIVLPNGTFTNANYTYNQDLFYALRGGGGGFGIIHSMTLKMHNASCKDSETGLPTMKDCYTYYFLNYTGTYDKTETPIYVKTLLELYLTWSIDTRSDGWNSVLNLYYYKDTKQYTVQMRAEHFGYNNSSSFFDTFSSETKDLHSKTIEKSHYYFCHSFKDNNTDCVDHPWSVEKWTLGGIWINLNSSVTTNGFTEELIRVWQPNCDRFPYDACADGFEFHGDLPAINKTSGHGVHSTGGAISPGFRTTQFNMFNFGVNSEKLNLTYDQKMGWMHFSLGPAMYKYSNSSYFNEVEYTLSPGQWQHRFWDADQYEKLIRIKQTYDPNLYLACRHCVGSKVGE